VGLAGHDQDPYRQAFGIGAGLDFGGEATRARGRSSDFPFPPVAGAPGQWFAPVSRNVSRIRRSAISASASRFFGTLENPERFATDPCSGIVVLRPMNGSAAILEKRSRRDAIEQRQPPSAAAMLHRSRTFASAVSCPAARLGLCREPTRWPVQRHRICCHFCWYLSHRLP
jgi:hypothetical protein